MKITHIINQIMFLWEKSACIDQIEDLECSLKKHILDNFPNSEPAQQFFHGVYGIQDYLYSSFGKGYLRALEQSDPDYIDPEHNNPFFGAILFENNSAR